MKSLVILAAALTLPTAMHAQESYKKELPEALVKKAKITETRAAEIAHARFPKGHINGVELEEEKGKLIFSYDIKTDGKSGIDEVNVDAMSGKIVAVEHESPAMEKKEAAEDAKAAKKSAPKKP